VIFNLESKSFDDFPGMESPVTAKGNLFRLPFSLAFPPSTAGSQSHPFRLLPV
jgi:hypothetical protein